MASLNTNVRASVTLSTTQGTDSSLPINPDKYDIEFVARKRTENKIIDLNPGQILDIDLSAEGYTSTDLIRIQTLTPNKTLKYSFNGATQRAELKPTSTTGYGFIIATVDANAIKLENPDLTIPISLALSIFQRQT